MEKYRLEINEKTIEYIIIEGVPSFQDYKNLEQEGFQTDYFHCETGDDIWDCEFYFAETKEDEELITKKLGINPYY